MMQPGRPASLLVALRAFLRAELNSPTESARLTSALERLDKKQAVVTSDEADEATLMRVFDRYRGHEALFEGLDLGKLEWWHSDLDHSGLSSLVYTCRNHFEDRFGTRRPAEVAARWDAEQRPNGVMDRIRQGDARVRHPLFRDARGETPTVPSGSTKDRGHPLGKEYLQGNPGTPCQGRHPLLCDHLQREGSISSSVSQRHQATLCPWHAPDQKP